MRRPWVRNRLAVPAKHVPKGCGHAAGIGERIVRASPIGTTELLGESEAVNFGDGQPEHLGQKRSHIEKPRGHKVLSTLCEQAILSDNITVRSVAPERSD